MVHNTISEICEECTKYVEKLRDATNEAVWKDAYAEFKHHKERHGIYSDK